MFRVDAAAGNRKLLLDPSVWDDCWKAGSYHWRWYASLASCVWVHFITPQPTFSAAFGNSWDGVLAFSMHACGCTL